MTSYEGLSGFGFLHPFCIFRQITIIRYLRGMPFWSLVTNSSLSISVRNWDLRVNMSSDCSFIFSNSVWDNQFSRAIRTMTIFSSKYNNTI